MNELHSRTNWGLGALGLLLGLGLIISTVILARTFRDVKSESQMIEVSGFAQKQITSNWAIWHCSFSVRAPSLVEANKLLAESRQKVVAFLTQKGAKPENIELNPVSMRASYIQDVNGRQTNVIEGYQMNQDLFFSSANVELVDAVAQNSSELVGQGIELSAEPPSYYYTKLDDLKLEMLGEAAANARLRAQKMAAQSESDIGALRYVHQGVFQITPPFSNEVSDMGVNDTSSKVKTIKAIVTARYAVAN